MSKINKKLLYLDDIFPIGKTEIFFDNNDHSNYMGFTWQRTAVGKAIVGIDPNDTDFNTIGKTGGEKTHILSTNEMPSHNHDSNGWAAVTDGSGNYAVFGAMSGGGTKVPTKNTGGDQPHNNLQPYEVFAIWVRTA